MFYAQFVLAKKGPLARIWLAAHWDKKLTKAHVFETNIEKSVDGILQPKVKMALRTSGHLLLGVVRIYSRKAKYLLADCNEAFVKIKMAFRPGMVDLPEDNREAAVNAITLPEVFHDFDTTMPELNDVDIEAQFSVNQSRAEEITMKEDYGHASALDQDNDFGPYFGEQPVEGSVDDDDPFRQSFPAIFYEEAMGSIIDNNQFNSVSAQSGMQVIEPVQHDDMSFTDKQPEPILFSDPPVEPMDHHELPPIPSVPTAAPESDDDDHFGGPASPMGHPSSDDGSRPGTPVVPAEVLSEAQSEMPPPLQIPQTEEEMMPPPNIENIPSIPPQDDHQETTHLVQNEEESFALAPVDASVIRGITKTKRKRKLIVDEVKNISGEEMKSQLSDTSDIVITLDLAPPTKRLMHWKESGGVEKLFALPGRNIPARGLFRMYQRHLTSRAAPNEDLQRGDENERDHVEQEQQIDLPVGSTEPASTKRGRKRKTLEPIEENIPQDVPEPPQPVEEVIMAPEEFVKPQETLDHQTSFPLPPESPAPPILPPPSVGPPDMHDYEPAPPTPFHDIHDIPQDSLLGQNSSFISGDFGNIMPTQPTPQHISSAQNDVFDNMGYQGHDELAPHSVQDPHPHMDNMGYDELHPPATTPGALSEKGQQTPYHEDYDMPGSVEPQEEQAVGETTEQYEERLLNKRAGFMYRQVKAKMGSSDSLLVSDLTYRANRKKAAQIFYSVLLLKKFKVLNLQQEASYAEITITRGQQYNNPAL